MLNSNIILKIRSYLLGLAFVFMFGCTQNSSSNSLRSQPFRPKISKQKLDTLNGSNFCWALLEPIHKKQGERDFSGIESQLSNGQKALYYFWSMDQEVVNGGFIQFYWNGHDKDLKPILAGLELVHDSTMSTLVQFTIHCFLNRLQYFFDQKKQNDRRPLYKNLPEFDSLNKNYYSLRNKTFDHFETFARNNPGEFIQTQ